MRFNPVALSTYLALRWVPCAGASWFGDYAPITRRAAAADTDVATSADILTALVDAVRETTAAGRVGLLLSGGIDSAILAALMPPGTPAYTIQFDAPGAVNEAPAARRYAERSGLAHTVVRVDWDDYERLLACLMRRKRAPLHPVEVGLCRAAQRAAADGITTLVVGNGADSTFGGLDRLLSRDWTFDEFVARYTFFDPAAALRTSAPVTAAFEPYRRGHAIDAEGFLKEVHGAGVTQAFANAIEAAGCSMRAPYESLRLVVPLDLGRIRAGESKYLLRAIFQRLYPGLAVPEKIPFARPMDEWMTGWSGPRRPEFRHDVDYAAFTGDQRWQLFCLERFLDAVEAPHA